MREQEFRARDKKVQKMTRDGLTEQNLTRGTQQRVSSRIADVSFRHGNAETDISGEGRMRKKTRHQESLQGGADSNCAIQDYLPLVQGETARSADAAAPRIGEPQKAPVSMRDAGDKTMKSEYVSDSGGNFSGQEAVKMHGLRLEPTAGSENRNPKTVTKGRLESAVKSEIFDDTEHRQPASGSDSGRGATGKKHTEMKKKQAVKFADSDANVGLETSMDSAVKPADSGAKAGLEILMDSAVRKEAVDGTGYGGRKPESFQKDSGQVSDTSGTGHSRLKFEPDHSKEVAGKNRAEMKKKQTMKFAGSDTANGLKVPMESVSKKGTADDTGGGRMESESVQKGIRQGFRMSDTGHGRLKFESVQIPGKPADKDRAKMKKKQAVKFSAPNTESEISSESVVKKEPNIYGEKTEADSMSGRTPRLHFEQGGKQSGEYISDAREKTSSEMKTCGKSRQQKKYEKAQKKMEKAEDRLEKARDKLPVRSRAGIQRQYDSEAGKTKYRLHFEKEIIPEHEKLSFSKNAVKAAGQTVSAASVSKIHQKLRETEQDNTGVEAAHKAGNIIGRGTGRFLCRRKRRIHEKPYREVRRAENRLAKTSADTAYQKMLMENPGLQKKTLAKWIQKQKLKRKYAAAARETAKGIQHTTNVLTATGQAIRSLAQGVAVRKTTLGIVAAGVLAMSLSGSLFSSCSAMLSGIQSAIVSTCYVADDAQINASELRYTELETDLQISIDSTETDYPGYDEYRYLVGEIGHSPYELMGYLSAAYDDFTYAQVEAELSRLFGLQYQLTREEVEETRTYTDDEGEEQEYAWNVLKVTLSVRPLSEIIASSLPAGEPTDRYGVYMQTCGNRQCYGNPFDFAWISRVTSPYGYRVHPISGEKNLHRGIDIGVPEGTPIHAVQDGWVVSAGDAGAYGLCVVIEGEDGYQSRYAHCSSLSVSAGQEVSRGDIIAAAGNTGNSTGAHLHLEVTHNGEYLNPYYYVDGGGSGYLPGGGVAGRPDFAENPGEAMGDGSFAAMLEEAEKFLGYPYVWGGSSPSTSFDCSGYVSWVINHSGVGSVGRQTAQGLYNLCTPVSRADMQPGDLVFFTGTYSSANPVTHVGIYVGGGRMIHCGSPISYANIDNNYWSSKFYSGGRLP